jgi:hypothetical protein
MVHSNKKKKKQSIIPSNQKDMLAYIPVDSLESLLSVCEKSFYLGLILAATQQHKTSLVQGSMRTTQALF